MKNKTAKSNRKSNNIFVGLQYLLEKEFIQIRRNKALPRMVILMPFIALALFPMVANFEIKDIQLAVVDNNHSTYSQRLTQKVVSSGYFKLTNVSSNYNQALLGIEQDNADVILEIPPRFEQDLVRQGTAQVSIAANSVNGMKGGLSSAYLSGIISDFTDEINQEWTTNQPPILQRGAEVIARYNYNPHLEYKYTMVPAIMMMMLALITGFLPALNIVGEKDKGTIEQMNVTPVSRFTLILSKLIPFWVMGFMVISICFFVAWLFYGMTSVGGYLLIYIFSAVFTLAFSGFGLVISNYAANIQQGMFIMFFFVITFIFLSGLYTPVSSMPEWTQTVSRISPLRYMVEALRFIFLKGSNFADLAWHFAALAGFALLFNLWAVLSYRKTQ